MKKVTDFEFILGVQSSKQKYEYLLVYNYRGVGPHCVYVKSYDAATGVFECMNSHGEVDKFPKVAMKDVISLHRVSCSGVEKVKKISLSSPTPCDKTKQCSIFHSVPMPDLDKCKKVESICKSWSHFYKNPTLSEVQEAAELAYQQCLTSLKRMVLRNMDVTLVPPAKLSQLTLIVKDDLFVNNLKGDISWILSNISCSNLNIDNMSN